MFRDDRETEMKSLPSRRPISAVGRVLIGRVCAGCLPRMRGGGGGGGEGRGEEGRVGETAAGAEKLGVDRSIDSAVCDPLGTPCSRKRLCLKNCSKCRRASKEHEDVCVCVCYRV